MTEAPKLLTTDWTMMFPTLTKLCWSIEGTATIRKRRNICASKSGASPAGTVTFNLLTIAMHAAMHETPWHMNVAQATPSTPIPKAVTKSISANIFAVLETARKMKGVRLSPIAVNIPVARL